MFPCSDNHIHRPRFKNKANQIDRRHQDILNAWQSGRLFS